MDSKSVKFLKQLLNDYNGDVDAVARYMRDSLHIGGLKACRALVLEAKAAS